jgi:hypothetical protein
MATENATNYQCPVCFNLDFDRLTEQTPPCVLDEYQIITPFSKMRASAESGNCLACGIICAGLENMQEQLEESEFLVDDTVLIMNLRRGHSFRVTVSNVGYERVLEFYTLSHKGVYIVLSRDGAC